MISKFCLICKREFESYRSANRIYCSKKCSAKDNGFQIGNKLGELNKGRKAPWLSEWNIKYKSEQMIGEKNPMFGKKQPSLTKYNLTYKKDKTWEEIYGEEQSLIVKKKLKNTLKEKWRNPKFREKMLPHFKNLSKTMKDGGAVKARRGCKSPSKPQIKLFNIIKRNFPTAKLEYPVKIFEGKHYLLDIAIPEHKINIEYDGAYWHQDKIMDEKRDKLLKELGWRIIRINNFDLMEENILWKLEK